MNVQGKFQGVNAFCKDCVKSCKQFENVTMVYCPMYKRHSRKDRQIQK